MSTEWALWRHGKSGWKWTGKTAQGRGRTYRTGGDGRGLFELSVAVNGQERWAQLLGASQFSLPDNESQAIYRLRSMTLNGFYNLATVADLSSLTGDF